MTTEVLFDKINCLPKEWGLTVRGEKEANDKGKIDKM